MSSTSAMSNLTLDLIVDERRRWIEKIPTGGWWGELGSKDVWPLTLKAQGVLDFGNSEDDPSTSTERFGSIELSDRDIVVGELFRFEYGGDIAEMKIESIVDLDELVGQ